MTTLNRKLTAIESVTEPLAGSIVAAAILKAGSNAAAAKLINVSDKTIARYRERYDLGTDEQINEKASRAAFDRALASVQEFYRSIWPETENAADNRALENRDDASTVGRHGVQDPSALAPQAEEHTALTPTAGNADNANSRSAPKTTRSLRGSARLSARAQGQPFDTARGNETPQRCTLCAQPTPTHLVGCIRFKKE